MANLHPLTPHNMRHNTHKLAHVSWPHIVWRHFTLCIHRVKWRHRVYGHDTIATFVGITRYNALSYSNKTESDSLRKCPYDHWFTNKAHWSAVTVTNIHRVPPSCRFLPTRWRQKSTGMDMEQNYATVTHRSIGVLRAAPMMLSTASST